MAPERSRESLKPPIISSRSWEALTPALAEWILSAMSSMGYQRMTPVQASTIPLFLGNKDVVVEAVTGSGKTLAYVLPMVQKLLRLEERTKKHHVAGIIVSPTRELATQIHSVVRNLLAFHAPSATVMNTTEENTQAMDTEEMVETPTAYPPSTPIIVSQLLVGGDTTTAQDLSYFLKQSPNLLIATPGRLLELLSSPHVHCPQSSFEVLVLDEADRLLDLGFKDDLQRILGRLPKQRRTGLFSASVSEAVDQIVRVGLRNPVKIQVKVKGASGDMDRKTPSSLQMSYLVTPASQKIPTISKLLASLDPSPNKTIIYFSTCAAVDYFQHVLPSVLPKINGQAFKLVSLHSKHPPKARTKNFQAFANSVTPSILLATDIAARGLDIPQVDLVLQFDPPQDPKVFLHRCGRAGRAGRFGLSILLLHPGSEEDYLPFLSVRKTPLSLFTNPAITAAPLEAQNTANSILKTALNDRALHDKAQKAFVSWVRAYSKHTASSIFRVSDLDWEDLCQAWGLLKLPKMPELKTFQGDRTLGLTIDWANYAYKDKKREEARQQAHQDGPQKPPESERPSTQSGDPKSKKRAWSDKLDAKDEREVRREKKHARRDREKWENMTPEERRQKQELEKMIEQVKSSRAKQAESGEFEGFDD